MRSADTEGEEDGEEEDGEINTDLKSKNPCVLDHCFSELPKKGLDSSQSHNRTSSNTPSRASWSASSTWSFSSSSMAAATWDLERSTSSCSLLRILPWGRDSSIRRIKELSRSYGEMKTPPIYSGETHQRHHLLRRNPVQNPSDHEVQSGQRSSVRPTSINRDIRWIQRQ